MTIPTTPYASVESARRDAREADAPDRIGGGVISAPETDPIGAAIREQREAERAARRALAEAISNSDTPNRNATICRLQSEVDRLQEYGD